MVAYSCSQVLLNFTLPKGAANDKADEEFAGRNTMLNETVNTEAFSSPKSDLITSSPHAGVSANAGVIDVSFNKRFTRLLPFLLLDLEFKWN